MKYTQQPKSHSDVEALRLADALDCHEHIGMSKAATELRRLHDELEAMTQCAKSHDEARTKYLLLNEELLAALKEIEWSNDDTWRTERARAAIAKATGG